MDDLRYFLACRSLGALEAADLAAKEFEARDDVPQIVTGPLDTEADEPEGADTIYRALTWGPLGPSYTEMLAAWFNTPPNAYLPLDALAAHLKLSVAQVQARFSKLSARLKRIATVAELADHRKTALTLLVDIAYAADTTSHRLTPAGRAATRRYLGRP